MSGPVLNRILDKRILRGKEDPKRLPERRGQAASSRPDGTLIWFHGASVGESLSALPVINKILAEDPDVEILVTTGTVTSAAMMAERLPARARHQFYPLDHPKWVARFLEHWQPDAVIWLESDFWPNMLMNIQARQIPMILMNARMGEVSHQRWSKYGHGSLRKILSGFDMCLTQSAAEHRRLEFFNHKDVRITDNLKNAADKLPFDKGQRNKMMLQISGRRCWQFISTHAGEEEMAFRIHKNLNADMPKLLTVIVPRHPNRADEIAKTAEAMGLNVAMRSRGDKLTGKVDIYLADTMGEIGLFLSMIDVTVVGGSFIPHGGHNPIEPAQFGNLVIFGPHMFNFELITEDFLSKDAALQLQDDAALEKALKRFLLAPEDRTPYQENALKLTQEKAAALENLWADISPWLTYAIGKSRT